MSLNPARHLFSAQCLTFFLSSLTPSHSSYTDVEEADPTLDSDAASDASSSDEDEGDKPDETAYEANDLVTTVVVEPFSLSRSASPILRARSLSGSPGPGDDEGEKKSAGPKMAISSAHKRRIKNKPQSRVKMTREDKKERAKGGKKVKAGFLKGSAGTKGRSNKG